MRHEYWPTKGNVPVVHGYRPWSGEGEEAVNGNVGKRHGKGDSPNEIMTCLSCRRPDCSNCLGRNEKYKRSVGMIPASFFFDVMAGTTAKTLSKNYHIGRDTVTVWKQRLGLPGKVPRWGSFPGETEEEGKRQKRS